MPPDSPARVSTIDASRMQELARPPLRVTLRHAAWIAAFVLLAVLGSWTHHAIDRSLRELRADSLSGMLDAQAQAIEVWIEEKKLATRRLARDRRLREHAGALLASPGRCASLEAAGLREPLDPFLQDETIGAAHVIDREGRIAAALPAQACGARIPAPLAGAATRALAGEPQFVKPLRDDAGLAAARTGESAPGIVWFVAPIAGRDGAPVAALALGKYADARFSQILSAARAGRTGKVYAFDERGLLAQAGVASSSTRLTEEAVSPGASSARRGVRVEPYENAAGTSVVGAWRWLPAYGFGLAMEMDADEAYAPLAFLNLAFTLVFAVVGGALMATLLYVLWVRGQMGRAQRLGAYVLERKIGEGGFSRVYLAQHALLRRPTAVKILRPDRTSEQAIVRFEREVKLASQLTHPNTVEIYDYGRTPDGQFYYAMEYLEGVELLDLIREGPIPVARVLYLLRQACAGLAEAHAKGLVHRDIKPENIMICIHGGEYDVVKILDFGLVKNVAEPHTRDMTKTLKFLGTPQYMAPERFRSPGDVDARADIYAIGAVAFYMLTGREVFQADDDLALSNRVLNEEAPRPSSASPLSIPVELDLLVLACLEKEREDRPQRVADLAEAFDALAAAHRWTQRDAADWWAKRKGPAEAGP
jgi:serine/threonine-protein kinase